MSANIYIDSKRSTIFVEGSVTGVAVLLGTAAAQILEGYFPGDKDRQMAWLSAISYAAMQAIFGSDKEDTTHED